MRGKATGQMHPIDVIDTRRSMKKTNNQIDAWFVGGGCCTHDSGSIRSASEGCLGMRTPAPGGGQEFRNSIPQPPGHAGGRNSIIIYQHCWRLSRLTVRRVVGLQCCGGHRCRSKTRGTAVVLCVYGVCGASWILTV